MNLEKRDNKMNTQKHTALPWNIKYQTHRTGYDTFKTNIETGEKLDWVNTNGNNNKANAEFIVTAANNHYQLIEALKECINFLPDDEARLRAWKVVHEAEGK